MDKMTKSKFKTSMGLSMFSLSMNRLSLANPASSHSQKIEFISELICLQYSLGISIYGFVLERWGRVKKLQEKPEQHKTRK